MARRLLKRSGETPAEALLPDAGGSVLALHPRKHSRATHAEALWRVVCRSALARRLR